MYVLVFVCVCVTAICTIYFRSYLSDDQEIIRAGVCLDSEERELCYTISIVLCIWRRHKRTAELVKTYPFQRLTYFTQHSVWDMRSTSLEGIAFLFYFKVSSLINIFCILLSISTAFILFSILIQASLHSRLGIPQRQIERVRGETQTIFYFTIYISLPPTNKDR